MSQFGNDDLFPMDGLGGEPVAVSAEIEELVNGAMADAGGLFSFEARPAIYNNIIGCDDSLFVPMSMAEAIAGQRAASASIATTTATSTADTATTTTDAATPMTYFATAATTTTTTTPTAAPEDEAVYTPVDPSMIPVSATTPPMPTVGPSTTLEILEEPSELLRLEDGSRERILVANTTRKTMGVNVQPVNGFEVDKVILRLVMPEESLKGLTQAWQARFRNEEDTGVQEEGLKVQRDGDVLTISDIKTQRGWSFAKWGRRQVCMEVQVHVGETEYVARSLPFLLMSHRYVARNHEGVRAGDRRTNRRRGTKRRHSPISVKDVGDIGRNQKVVVLSRRYYMNAGRKAIVTGGGSDIRLICCVSGSDMFRLSSTSGSWNYPELCVQLHDYTLHIQV